MPKLTPLRFYFLLMLFFASGCEKSDEDIKKSKDRILEITKGNSSIRNDKDNKITILSYMDRSSHFSNFSVNITMCKIFDFIRSDSSSVEYEKVRIQWAAKDLEVIDEYGNEVKKDVRVMWGNWFLSDIKLFNCDNDPDVFLLAEDAKFYSIIEGDLRKDCIKKISKGKSGWIGLCEFL